LNFEMTGFKKKKKVNAVSRRDNFFAFAAGLL
jgi:hypothetical protein